MYTIAGQLSTRYVTDTNCTLVLSWKTKHVKKGHVTLEKTVNQLKSPSSVTNLFRRSRADRYITVLPKNRTLFPNFLNPVTYIDSMLIVRNDCVDDSPEIKALSDALSVFT